MVSFNIDLTLYVLSSVRTRNTPSVNGKAHGISRKEEHIGVVIDVTGIGSGNVKTRYSLVIRGKSLTVFAD
jgi:hypothetical protein